MNQDDPNEKLAPFEALIGEWDIEMTHRLLPDTVVRGKTAYEWLEGGRFLVERSVVDHPDFPDSMSVIGVMEGDDGLSMQQFDSRGTHRVYDVAFDGKELTISRDEPGFEQRGTAKLSEDGSTLTGVWQLNQDGQGWVDDLTTTCRRA